MGGRGGRNLTLQQRKLPGRSVTAHSAGARGRRGRRAHLPGVCRRLPTSTATSCTGLMPMLARAPGAPRCVLRPLNVDRGTWRIGLVG